MFKRFLNATLLMGLCVFATGCQAVPTWMGANVKVSANAP